MAFTRSAVRSRLAPLDRRVNDDPPFLCPASVTVEASGDLEISALRDLGLGPLRDVVAIGRCGEQGGALFAFELLARLAVGTGVGLEVRDLATPARGVLARGVEARQGLAAKAVFTHVTNAALGAGLVGRPPGARRVDHEAATTIGSWLAPDFVTEGNSVILEGKTGRGKTHLAVAIAYRALQNGFDARLVNCAELLRARHHRHAPP